MQINSKKSFPAHLKSIHLSIAWPEYTRAFFIFILRWATRLDPTLQFEIHGYGGSKPKE